MNIQRIKELLWKEKQRYYLKIHKSKNSSERSYNHGYRAGINYSLKNI